MLISESGGYAAGGRAQLSEKDADRVVRLMERYAPSAPLSWLVDAGASAVASELARDAAAE